MDTRGIVNLEYVVHLVLMDIGDDSLRDYKKFLQYAILGFQELNLYVSQSVKVAYLPISETKTANLPDDYITYTKIGYNNGGVIATFGLNEDLMMPHKTDDCGNQVNDNLGRPAERRRRGNGERGRGVVVARSALQSAAGGLRSLPRTRHGTTS